KENVRDRADSSISIGTVASAIAGPGGEDGGSSGYAGRAGEPIGASPTWVTAAHRLAMRAYPARVATGATAARRISLPNDKVYACRSGRRPDRRRDRSESPLLVRASVVSRWTRFRGRPAVVPGRRSREGRIAASSLARTGTVGATACPRRSWG